MPVIDASVYIVLINQQEPSHQASWEWLQQVRAEKSTLIAPSILVAEVAAALSRGVDDQKLAHQVINRLLSSQLISLEPVTIQLAERSAKIAADNKIRGCDSIYVALAELRGEELVTLDNQQFTRGKAIVSVKRPDTI